jgi:hypothetical protein
VSECSGSVVDEEVAGVPRRGRLGRVGEPGMLRAEDESRRANEGRRGGEGCGDCTEDAETKVSLDDVESVVRGLSSTCFGVAGFGRRVVEMASSRAGTCIVDVSCALFGLAPPALGLGGVGGRSLGLLGGRRGSGDTSSVEA